MAVMPDRPVAEVLQDIVGNIQSILRSEIRMARVEVRERVAAATGSAKWLGAAVVTAVYAGLFALLSAMYGLALIMPLWLAGLVVTGAMVVISIGLVSTGIARVKAMQHLPTQTTDMLRENVEWLNKRQTR